MPLTVSAIRKFHSVRPLSAAATPTSISTTPQAMTVVAPNRLIRLPVKNDGTNMPSTCMKMTQWASACGNPQPTMASGEALMMKDIVPNASMPAIADAMKRGWLAITSNGRGGAAASVGPAVAADAATEGKLIKDMTVKTMTCRPRMAAYVAR